MQGLRGQEAAEMPPVSAATQILPKRSPVGDLTDTALFTVQLGAAAGPPGLPRHGDYG